MEYNSNHCNRGQKQSQQCVQWTGLSNTAKHSVKTEFVVVFVGREYITYYLSMRTSHANEPPKYKFP
jgi:hypothetical protein